MSVDSVNSNNFNITKGYFEAITRFECDVAAIAAKVTILAFPIIVLVTLFLDFLGCGKEENPAPVVDPTPAPVKNSEIDNSRPDLSAYNLKPPAPKATAPEATLLTVDFGTHQQVPKVTKLGVGNVNLTQKGLDYLARKAPNIHAKYSALEVASVLAAKQK